MLVTLNADVCCAFSNLKTSLTITGGVRTTARAKLNSSTFLFAIPRRSPVDMVAPERENPRKGKQIPCTAPIQQELLRSVEPFLPGLLSLIHPAKIINTPTAASAAEIKGIFPKRSSTSAWGTPLNKKLSIKAFNDNPTIAVMSVAKAMCFVDSQKTLREAK